MLRVLFIEASTGGVVGGSLTGLVHLIRGLDARRFSSCMVLYERKPNEQELSQLGVRLFHVHRARLEKEHALLGTAAYERARRFDPVRKILRFGRQTLRLLVEEIPASLRIARIIRKSKADVVHLGNGVRANFDGILACRLTGIPAICHVKGFEKYSAREQWGARQVSAIVCMTFAILEHCRTKNVVAPKMAVVYDGVDESWIRTTRSSQDVRRELGIPEQAFCIGVAGNVQEWKGQHVLVEAAAMLRESFPAAQFLVIGGVHRAGEAYANHLRRQASEFGIADRIHFTGFRNDIVDVLNSLDVVVHTSVRPEPFGRVILEGMLLGKPVIASAAGGVPELIEHGRTGFLIPPGDAGALAEQLSTLMRDLEWGRTIGAQSRVWARERFALHKQVEEMGRLYEAAVGRS